MKIYNQINQGIITKNEKSKCLSSAAKVELKFREKFLVENCEKGDLKDQKVFWSSLKSHLDTLKIHNEKIANAINEKKKTYLHLLTSHQQETTEMLNEFYYSNAYLLERILKTIEEIESINPSLKESSQTKKQEL